MINNRRAVRELFRSYRDERRKLWQSFAIQLIQLADCVERWVKAVEEEKKT